MAAGAPTGVDGLTRPLVAISEPSDSTSGAYMRGERRGPLPIKENDDEDVDTARDLHARRAARTGARPDAARSLRCARAHGACADQHRDVAGTRADAGAAYARPGARRSRAGPRRRDDPALRQSRPLRPGQVGPGHAAAISVELTIPETGSPDRRVHESGHENGAQLSPLTARSFV